MTTTSIPVACTPDKLTKEQHARLFALVAQVFSSASSAQPTEGGYVLTFEGASPADIAAVGELIALDSLCCPFADHVLTIGSGYSPAVLTLSGPEGTREVFQYDIEKHVSGDRLLTLAR